MGDKNRRANTAEELVEGVVNLITLPDIYIRVNQVLEDPDHNAQQLGEVISYDPALTTRILRIVNSAYYSLAVKIELVSRAVSVLGENDIRNLILATSAVETFKCLPNQLLDIDLFWRHSVYTGIVSRLLSQHCNILHRERLFIAGMLHDIGKLVLYYKEPELSQEVLLQAAENSGALYQAEADVIGFTHADVGGALVGSWKLADTLKDVITYHHTPLKARQYPLETAIVHIANCVVNAITPDTIVDEHLLEGMDDFETATLTITGLDLNILPDVMEQAREQAIEVMDIVCPKNIE